MATELRPIRSEADYKTALEEVERLWGAKSDTPEGDRLDVLATLIEGYKVKHYPMDPPDPVEAIRFRMEQQGLALPARTTSARALARTAAPFRARNWRAGFFRASRIG